ncbi:MAG: hypothetical protein QF898_00280 [SAR202 cluster bacterium]|nr:hypothetical protein [SAR202 cluster bacterium]MDP6512528.1 hypothetical protein [SAR202 cluster bacterium]MDP6714319.1 hypothetical protein [SAR202 cluster bacterium]
MSIAEIIAMTRDIAFLSILLTIMVIFIVLYLKVSALVGSGRRIAKNTEETVSTLSERFTEYAGEDMGLISSAGKATSLLLWPTRSWLRLGLTGLTGIAALAWTKNWLGIRTATNPGDSIDKNA